jgi:heat shock protein HslJ
MRTNLFLSLVLVAIALGGLGCSSESVACFYHRPQVENYRWNIVQAPTMPVPLAMSDEQQGYFLLNSENHTATGYTGINNFNGPYELNGERLRFGVMAQNQMAGIGPLVQQEAALNTALTNAAAWRPFGQNEIDLLDAGGFSLGRFTRGAANEMK